MAEVSVAVECACLLGESPLWDHRQGRLYWVDSLGGSLFALAPTSGATRQWQLPSKIGSIGLRRNRGLLAALEDEIGFFSPRTGRYQTFASVGKQPAGSRLNDGVVCKSGRFWVGSLNVDQAGAASLFRIDGDGSVATVDTGFTISNGLAFNPDESCLYFADTPRQVVFRYDHDPASGKLANRRRFLECSSLPGRPDGASIDTSGNYWVAMVRGGCIGCFSPEGELLRTIEMPVAYPTMCAFGGENLDTLYVTSTRHLLEPADARMQTLDGSLFRITGLGVRGFPNSEFTG